MSAEHKGVMGRWVAGAEAREARHPEGAALEP